MKLFALFTFLIVLTINGATATEVIPRPLRDEIAAGTMLLKPKSFAYVPMESQEFYLNQLRDAGADVQMAPADASCAVQFLSADMMKHLGGTMPKGEGYALIIKPETILIYAESGAGHFYGLQTLCQIIGAAPKDDAGNVKLACRDIRDQPRFAWRGFMLDESRHFTGMEALKKQLDAMARYKLNRFHWHLTDSPGWRIEIKKYPKLTEVGSRGCETDVRADAPQQYYTQEQIREIVAYARERHIKVIPEIDMPGHADAAVKSYPEHDGGGYVSKADKNKWPQFTFNPAKAETLQFLDDILTEVAALFPDAGVIHFGGDEVHFGWQHWTKLPEVADLMKKENIKDLHGVEEWFNRRMANKINDLGFRVGGWDEITARNLPKDKTLIFWWRHDKEPILQKALAAGYPVILCPRRPCYLDFVQHESHKEGRRWQGFNPWEDLYQFPDQLKLTAADEAKVEGMQACLWTEATVSQERREFLTWPRLIVLAESAWTPRERKDIKNFRTILPRELDWLKAKKITFYDPFRNSAEITDDGVKVEYLDNE